MRQVIGRNIKIAHVRVVILPVYSRFKRAENSPAGLTCSAEYSGNPCQLHSRTRITGIRQGSQAVTWTAVKQVVADSFREAAGAFY